LIWLDPNEYAAFDKFMHDAVRALCQGGRGLLIANDAEFFAGWIFWLSISLLMLSSLLTFFVFSLFFHPLFV